MKLLRLSTAAVALLFFVTSSMFLFSQAGTEDKGTGLKIHRFQPPVSARGADAAPASGSTHSGELSESAVQQINALEQDKQSRTVTQAKISSRLLYTARMLQGQAAAPGIPVLRTNVELDEQNNLFVDITARVSDDLLQRLRSLGVRIIRSDPAYRSIRAFISPYQLEAVAAFPEVIFIGPRREAMTVGSGADSLNRWRGPLSPGFAQRAARVREKLSAQLARKGPDVVCTGQGSVTSEGYATHRAADACATFGVTGAGVKIGVLSDGVSSLAASQALGDLPADVTVLPGQECCGDEGTAMLEIIHDLAPDAKLFFATAFNGIDSFAQNIRDLRTAGCDIIVDDVFYFVESPFQDGQAPSVISTWDGGVVIQAANDVTAAGAMYFSSAGNEGSKDDGTSGTYEGDFVDGGANSHLPGGTVTKFGTNTYDTITFQGGPILLHWADPLGGSANDYDLFVFNSTGTTILDASTDFQTGTQDPIEGVGTDDTGDRVVVFKVTGAANRFFHVEAIQAELSVATAGEVHGHAGASGAFAVGATPAYLPICGLPICPTGPWPDPFNASNVIEPYSSDGPRRIFFLADGTAITPGNFSSTGGTVLPKPEFTAADGVSVTGVGGFGSPFYGTSAAAPHAAAIAGLVKSLDSTLTNSDISAFLSSSAIDIMSAGADRDSGAGIVMAFEAVQAATAPSITNLSPISGDVGTPVTITGKNFGAIQGTSTVTFNGTATTPTSWSATSIVVPVPAGATNGNVVVTVSGLASNGVVFTLMPHITGLSPNVGPVGTPVTITGTNFGSTQGTSTVTFNGTTAAPTSWSATSIVVPVPSGATTGNVVVTINGVASSGVNFTVLPTPNIASLSPTSGPVGTPVTISGTNFGATPGTSTITFNGTTATPTSWSATSIIVPVPNGATTGNVLVTVNGVASNGVSFTVFLIPGITGLSTNSAPAGTPITITGMNFGSTQGTSTVTFNGQAATVTTWGDTSIVVNVPAGATTGNVVVTVNGIASNGIAFTVQDFSVPATLTDITVTAGQSQSQNFTITPGGAFDGAITFACSGLPSKSSCTFTPSSVTPGGSPVPVAMKVSTTAATTSGAAPAIYGMWLPFGGLGLVLAMGAGTRKRRRKALGALALFLLLPLLLAITSCGGGGSTKQTIPGTPPGTYNLTMRATSGPTSHSSTFKLIVK
jgi:hypothetical protein